MSCSPWFGIAGENRYGRYRGYGRMQNMIVNREVTCGNRCRGRRNNYTRNRRHQLLSCFSEP